MRQEEIIIHTENNTHCTQNIDEDSRIFGVWDTFDVFAFTPVPVYCAKKVSSRRGCIASVILIFLISIYAIYTITIFFANNTPKTAEQERSIGNKIFTMPNIAMTVIPNLQTGVSFIDETYYGVNISQNIIFKGLTKPKTETRLGTDYNCTVDWLSEMNFTSFICPHELGNMQGSPFTSDEFRYIKIDLFTCVNGSHPDIICKDKETIENTLKTLRFVLFIEQDATFYDTTIDDFKTLFYYPTFQFTQKYELYLKNKEVTTSPDFFFNFRKKRKQGLFYDREKTYMSELFPGQENLALTIWLRLSEEESIQKQVPETVMDIFGKWGALWGVLLSAGALYFMAHNRRKFYEKNREFLHFGQFTQKLKNSVPPGSLGDLEMAHI